MVRWIPWSGGSEPDMRASHDDRDSVAEVLRVAAGDGYLTPDELDERLEAALTARTRGELTRLTVDLPLGAAFDHGRAPAQDVVRIEQKYGSPVARSGPWTLPRRVEVATKWVGVTLDLTEAVLTGPVLEVDVAMTGGELIFVTRPGMVVDITELRLAHCVVRRRDPQVEPGTPVSLRVHVRGRKKHGGIVVRPATRTLGQWLLGKPPTHPA